jgi:lipopolysaccharide export system permease protein
VRLLSRFDRYIGRHVLVAMLLVFGTLLTLLTFFEVINALRNYGQGSFGLYALVVYVGLTLPRRIYELFPIAVLLGTVLGLSWLAVGSELTAMRAAGISLARIAVSAMKAGLLLVAFCIVIGETVVPIADTAAQRGEAEALHWGLYRERTGLWLRDATSFVNVGEILPDLTLLDVNIYRFDRAERLRAQTYARRARFQPPVWQLEDVSESQINDRGVQTHRAQTAMWQAGITPDVVQIFAVRPESLSSANLYEYIQHLRRNHQETDRYQLAFWHKVWLPVTTALMVLLAVPAVFGQARSGGMGHRVFLGLVLGLTFDIVNRGFGYLCLLYGMSALMAVLTPIGLFLLFAGYLFRRVG